MPSADLPPLAGRTREIAIYTLKVVAIAAALAAFAKIQRIAPWFNPAGTPVWPPTGIAISALFVFGNRSWPGVAAGAFLSCIIAGQGVLVSAFASIGMVGAALAGCGILNHWAHGWKAFQNPRGVSIFAFLCIPAAAAIGSAGAVAGFSLASGDFEAYAPVWPLWWLADVAGSVVLAPVIILWATAPYVNTLLPRTLFMVAASAVIGFCAFSPAATVYLDINSLALPYHPVIGFLILLPLIWSAMRNDQPTAATAVLAFIGAAVWGLRPAEPTHQQAIEPLLQFLVLASSVSMSSLVVTAAFVLRRNMCIHLASARDRASHELEQMKTALDLSKHHFQALIDDVADHAVFVLDTAGRVASWNSGAQRITGYAQEEVLGKPFGLFYRPDERRAGEPVRALQAAIQIGRHELEGWRIRKDGTPFFATGVVSVIRDRHGDLIGFSSIMRDTTERRDAQEKLVEAREQLAMAQKMEAIGKLTGGIAHDFNNLLMIIGGNAQTFKKLLDPKLPRAIEAIQTAAKRGETLTRQLLTFSRSQHVSPSVVDLAAVMRNMRPMIESSLRGNIVYKDMVANGPTFTKVDLAELELAIVNIAVNARDAMPQGGTFALSISEVTAPYDSQGSQLDGAFAAIRFSDTGAGIPPNLLSKIFDPFFTTKEVGKGTGLGLSQVYGFVHQAGGTIKVDSKIGEGTAFTIYLPLCAERQLPAVSAPARSNPPRPRVLVVDDNPDVRHVTSALFEQIGYDTALRDSAESALQYLAQGKKVDLVFSDIVMPGSIDGIGLAGEIRGRYPGLPVILSTGYSDSAQQVPQWLQVLRKPFDSEALVRALEGVSSLEMNVQRP